MERIGENCHHLRGKKEDADPRFKEIMNTRNSVNKREPKQNGCRGVWVTSGILGDPKLRHIDKLILAYVQGFGEEGCFASNHIIAQLIGGKHPRSVQNRISSLIKSGYLEKKGSHWFRKLYLGRHIK